MKKRLMMVVAALSVSSPAFALDAWMWGVGPKIGTNFLPGRAPLKFPGAVGDDELISKTGFDFVLGADAVYYANANHRLGVSGDFDFGKNMFDTQFLIKYDYIQPSQAVDFVLGAGVGAGYMQWSGEGDSKLLVPYYPLRPEMGIMVRDGARAYHATAYLEVDVPSRQTYKDATGDTVDTLGGTGFYMSAGLELGVLFGDFTPPKPKQR